MESFGARLHRAVRERGPLCVGIDPHPALLARWGLADDVDGLRRFAATVVDALGDRVAVVKPQSAFFERFGSHGVAVLESTIRQLRERGALVLLDVKRGDIGSTVQAYASAYLDPSSPMHVDAITASPFLGVGSLAPMFELAAEHGGGVFVLALTSNPEGASVQRATTADGRTVAQTVIDEISQLNAGAEPLGSIGAVVGATVGETGCDLSAMNGPLLAPGLGAQGATAADLRVVFGSSLPAVLPSYSREVLGAGPDPEALRAAADRTVADCRAALKLS
ncbi:orotidine-5'-phosphate decarboxylase [Micromonospora gifhornensis]|uniref:Orotidine 5'-phosphate decarboxylase n=1 Tax=Micromonospora gifhornensis TaxID=84594 RepID=A0ABQ4IIJ0_9ACTN|nr:MULTISPECIES: orotidine-5'-phosphate decarboxylase [Micromonospora]PMR60258.1 orotidine-5'-phosphate decarboxylase [Verrucosispora sp. ts21]GIJ17712.1 orotidine 5'-phosphate decarboxylase [Micromonospora gifhornensis]